MTKEFFDKLSEALLKGEVLVRVKYVKDKDRCIIVLLRPIRYEEIARYEVTREDAVKIINTLNKHYFVKYDFLEGITFKVYAKKIIRNVKEMST